MCSFAVREVVYPSEYPHRRLNANNYYEDYIIRHWPRDAAAVLSLWLHERAAAAWQALGEVLTRDLLTLGQYAGLSFNGDFYAAGTLAQVAQRAGRMAMNTAASRWRWSGTRTRPSQSGC